MFFLLPITFNVATSIVSLGLAASVGIIIYKRLTAKQVKEEVLQIPDSFAYKIKKAKKNSINVGIFDNKLKKIDTIEMQFEESISKDVVYNKMLYI